MVRRIFRAYAAGKSAKTIAFAMNRNGIPAPSGSDWASARSMATPSAVTAFSTTRCMSARSSGTASVSSKTLIPVSARPVRTRIGLGYPGGAGTAHSRRRSLERRESKAENRTERDESGVADVRKMNHRRRPKYLFSGLTKCACCGGGYSAISATLIGCSTARNKGTCDNRVNIRREELEARVLNALRTKLVDPEMFARFCEEMNRLRMEGRAGIASAEAEIAKIDRELDPPLNLSLTGGAADAINAKMVLLEQRKKELVLFLAEAEEPPPLLYPSMALQYRKRVQQLHEALQDEEEEKRIEAADILARWSTPSS